MKKSKELTEVIKHYLVNKPYFEDYLEGYTGVYEKLDRKKEPIFLDILFCMGEGVGLNDDWDISTKKEYDKIKKQVAEGSIDWRERFDELIFDSLFASKNMQEVLKYTSGIDSEIWWQECSGHLGLELVKAIVQLTDWDDIVASLFEKYFKMDKSICPKCNKETKEHLTVITPVFPNKIKERKRKYEEEYEYKQTFFCERCDDEFDKKIKMEHVSVWKGPLGIFKEED